jgi:hypothetical protein
MSKPYFPSFGEETLKGVDTRNKPLVLDQPSSSKSFNIVGNLEDMSYTLKNLKEDKKWKKCTMELVVPPYQPFSPTSPISNIPPMVGI